MILEKMKIYGVDNVGQSFTTLTRTDSATNLTYTVGQSEIKSDFDNCYPWCEMTEIVDETGNVFVKIPKFYSKITKNANGTYKLQISGCRYDGFSTLFIDGEGNEIDYVLVGKYEGSYDADAQSIKSQSGKTIKTNLSLTNFRTACKKNGEGYQQYDFLIDCIIKELFTIEFANTDSQSIMKGFTHSDNTTFLITGHTDNVKTPSGSYNNNHDLLEEPWTDTSCNTDGKHACKYRGMENLWGNTWTWCDGINFDNTKVFICTNPKHYQSNKYDAPYFYVGERVNSSGYVKVVAPLEKNTLLTFVSELGAGSSTYYSDFCYNSESGKILACGGSWRFSTNAGLWMCNGVEVVDVEKGDFSCRLCYKPL
ncbi:MAG TPA: hypothetical protein DDY82_03405 [Clostridiales bacterium]|nr:hypothetical protein [Clostridiales bacterium]